ncbi:hypothetical protein [Polaribacter sp. IC073]|uniref:hypothetical protein n=1 Tax=Polaribacter sp. IC073 TaxID=2508540 RepID=UPI0011BE11A4|nr:hypothetical protein [Polaribacter sp. IC073]TXD46872.1 hypothetical protein ES045_12945 [Polaribacter sp. IC073]
MKKILLTLSLIILFSVSYGQNNSEIANVYINRANIAIEERIDFKEASLLFEKAMKYMDTITSTSVAKLGTKIYFELEKYKEAKKYSKYYFLNAEDKKSDTYFEQLELFITISEALEFQQEEEKRAAKERLRKAAVLKKIDSLKTIWQHTSKRLSLKVDSIYQFNMNNYAVYRKNGKFGIINDKAEIIKEAKEYAVSISYAGFILLKNKEKEPTRIYYYNTNNGTGTLLPKPSDFKSLSNHYGKVMLPRANGCLVTYPNNSFGPMIFDLNKNKIIKTVNKEQVFNDLKKNDIIRRYNNDQEIKVDKEWYTFGGDLGGGIYPLYLENNYRVHAFLCSEEGAMLFAASSYDYIGAFYNGSAQAVKGNKVFWINQRGEKVQNVNDKRKKYAGNSKVVKVEDGVYQILKDGVITKGNETLEKRSDFLKRHQE